MSYNIDRMSCKIIDEFTLKLSDLKREDFAVELELSSPIQVVIYGGAETAEIRGIVKTASAEPPVEIEVSVKDIKWYGEGSGHTYDQLIDALKKGKGKLELKEIWEGGDSISKTIIDNGKVIEQDIDLDSL